MVVFEDTVYWTDRQINRVNRADKFSGVNSTVVTYKIAQPLGIVVYHNATQPQEANPCANAGCSHLCLLSANSTTGYTCVCSAGFQLGSDQKTCAEVANLQFLLAMQEKSIRGIKMEEKNNEFQVPFSAVGIENGFDFAVDPENHKFYYTQKEEKNDNVRPLAHQNMFWACEQRLSFRERFGRLTLKAEIGHDCFELV